MKVREVIRLLEDDGGGTSFRVVVDTDNSNTLTNQGESLSPAR
jgi:hypothetical protein